MMHLPGFLDQQYLSFSSGAAILVNLCLVGLCKSGRPLETSYRLKVKMAYRQAIACVPCIF